MDLEKELEKKRGNVRAEAIVKYGQRHQIIVAIEELSELQQALTKCLRSDTAQDEWNVAEEIGDVEIALEQLKMMFRNETKVEESKRWKIERLEARLDDEW